MALIALIVLLLACALFGKGRELLPWDKNAVLPLRGVLVFLVVLGHALDEMGCRGFSLAYPAVAVFLFISGYGLMQKRLSANASAGFLHVINKIIPPFLIVSLIYSAILICCGKEMDLWGNIISGSSNLPIPFAWYIPAAITFYAIFYLANLLCRRNCTLVVCVVSGVIAYWTVTALVFSWPFYWWKATGGFVSGLLFALYEMKFRQFMKTNLRVVYGMAAVFLSVVFMFACSEVFFLRFVAGHFALACIGPAIALVMFTHYIPCKCLWSRLGGISYEVYLVHGIFVVWTRSLAAYFQGGYFITVFALSLLTGGLLRWVVKRGRSVAGL